MRRMRLVEYINRIRTVYQQTQTVADFIQQRVIKYIHFVVADVQNVELRQIMDGLVGQSLQTITTQIQFGEVFGQLKGILVGIHIIQVIVG